MNLAIFDIDGTLTETNTVDEICFVLSSFIIAGGGPVNFAARLLSIAMKYLIAIVLSLVLASSASTNARSHSRAVQKFPSGISGRITDPNGAVIVGARITIVSRSSQPMVSRKSDDNGAYAADLKPDTYDVSVEAQGFKKARRKAIPVLHESRPYVDFVLEVAEPIMPKLIN